MKLAFMCSLNLKPMFANIGIATIYLGLFILLFILTLKATQQLMHQIIFLYV